VPTQEQRAKRVVELMMHQAHLRYQRQVLAPSPQKCYIAPVGDAVRGLHRQPSASERRAMQFKPEWFTHLRPNFWKAYFESLIKLAQ
jgi:hypothetical protein